MATLTISLTPELAALVDEKVSSGRYHSVSEVVQEGLRLLKAHEEIRQARLGELKQEIALGTEQLERGEYTIYASGKELAAKIKSEARQRLESREKAGA